LQIIDTHDLSNPTTVGRMPIAGAPVERYVDGDRSIALLNDRDHRSARGRFAVANDVVGMALLVDISNRNAPKLLSQLALHLHVAAQSSRDATPAREQTKGS
jgi:hypothetical protein